MQQLGGKKKTEEAVKGILCFLPGTAADGCGPQPLSKEFTLCSHKQSPRASQRRGSHLIAEKYREAEKCHKSEEIPEPPGHCLHRLSCWAPRRPAIHSCALCKHQAPRGRSGLFVVWAMEALAGARTRGQRDVYQVVRGGKNVGLPPGGTGFSAAADSK